MKYTQIPTNTFRQLALNAGILAKSFNPETEAVGDLFGATGGGINFSAVPSFTDFAEGIDNANLNTKEMKEIDNWTVTMSGTFKTVTPELAKTLAAAADIDEDDATHVIPRRDLEQTDFTDVWFIGDYGREGGYIAIHLMSALSTGGFQIQTNDRGKGDFAFTFTGHYSIDAQDTVPFEIYIKGGPIEYTYTEATLSTGFNYGTTYYTRSGTSPNYVYTEVSAGTAYDSEVTYYTRSVSNNS